MPEIKRVLESDDYKDLVSLFYNVEVDENGINVVKGMSKLSEMLETLEYYNADFGTIYKVLSGEIDYDVIRVFDARDEALDFIATREPYIKDDKEKKEKKEKKIIQITDFRKD